MKDGGNRRGRIFGNVAIVGPVKEGYQKEIFGAVTDETQYQGRYESQSDIAVK